MPRHEFRPGRLVAGLFFALAGVIYAGDAGGLWETPWFAAVPVVLIGLALAGTAGATARSVRRRRSRASGGAANPTPAPTSTAPPTAPPASTPTSTPAPESTPRTAPWDRKEP
ncbi:hypothetical protein ACVNF4_29720 [Streptomyces sp. S6]